MYLDPIKKNVCAYPVPICLVLEPRVKRTSAGHGLCCYDIAICPCSSDKRLAKVGGEAPSWKPQGRKAPYLSRCLCWMKMFLKTPPSVKQTASGCPAKAEREESSGASCGPIRFELRWKEGKLAGLSLRANRNDSRRPSR